MLRFNDQGEIMSESPFEELLGKTLEAVDGLKTGNDSATFICTDGSRYQMVHDQDCCECVLIEDVCGDLADLIGSPLLQAEEVSNPDFPDPPNADSFTWTFYKLGTMKGRVTIRWLGESNGYYSESVSFYRTQDPRP